MPILPHFECAFGPELNCRWRNYASADMQPLNFLGNTEKLHNIFYPHDL